MPVEMSDNDEQRPSPEALLKLAQAEEDGAERGRLNIFLGYAAGVGKTYAMLSVARQRRQSGADVVVGYVESHGRPETDALLEGLEVIPKAAIVYQGVSLPELDLDAVLARRPQIALVDELAHSNAPGSRHEKRWQDVQELLNGGIDVYTTVNIQHFESLNDVVAQITGVVVRETVPDLLLDQAAEIRLVDITPEDLLQRLQEGKVYVPEQAAKAMEKFFQAGNLIALRELSMRHAASRVDDQMRAYQESRALPGHQPVAERLLVCISGSPFSERLLRITRRLASEMKAPWYAVYVEPPGSDKYARENRDRIWRDLRLAENMGAQVATITAASVAEALVDYAQHHGITKMVVGKPAKSRWRELLRPPIVDQVIRRSGQIDVFVVSIRPLEQRGKPLSTPRRQIPWSGYLGALGLVAGATLLCSLIRPIFSPTNMVMIYLLAVVVAAIRLGRAPAILTAFLGVLAFDWFFVPPSFTFEVANSEYLLTFVALFTVGVVISNLVARGRERAEAMWLRELQTASLYYLSRDLAMAADTFAIIKAVQRNLAESLNGEPLFFQPIGEKLEYIDSGEGSSPDLKERAVADWVFRNQQQAGRGTDTLGSASHLYLPLKGSASLMGVLGVKLSNSDDYTSKQHRLLLDAFAGQTAMALERVQLTQQAGQAQILATRENLERALLNSISHDLRTPLATITGILTSLREQGSGVNEQIRAELLDTACGEASRLNRFVGNLLDMTRIEAGGVKLKLEPCDLQDLVGCALAHLETRLAGRPVQVEVPDNLPPVLLDMVLMNQVLVNLLENSVKFSPAGSAIDLSARIDRHALRLEVADRGYGLPEPELKKIFDKFYMVQTPEGPGGTGLGLSICKGIVEAHGGTIRAENRGGGGLRMIMRLPLRLAPEEGGGHGK
jgi:two-component system sensor histidine kinase KdpD